MQFFRFLLALILTLFFVSFSHPDEYFTFENSSNTGLKKSGNIRGFISLPKRSLRRVLRKRRPRRYGRSVIRAAKRARKYNAYETSLVYLLPLNPKNNQKILKTQILSQKDVSFQPAHLVVQLGSKVNILNRDNIFHNVFSSSKKKRFNIGKVRKNIDKLITFNRTGHIQVFCDIHAFMNGIISVVNTPYFTKCNKYGKFEIKNIPAGRYKLIGWHTRSEYKETLIDIKAERTVIVKNMKFK